MCTCVCAHTREIEHFPCAPRCIAASVRRRPLSPHWRPKSSSLLAWLFRLPCCQAQQLRLRMGSEISPQKTKIPSQIPKVPPQLPPLTHLSGYCWGNWHPQPHLENRCRKRQRCTAYSFLHWRKRSPGPTIDLVFPPLPLILLAALPALFLLQFLACFFPSSLPSVRFLLFLLEGEPSS